MDMNEFTGQRSSTPDGSFASPAKGHQRACLPRCELIGSWGIPPNGGSVEAFQHAEERTGVMDDTDGPRGKEDKLLRSLQYL